MPRFFLASRLKRSSGETDSLTLLSRAGFDPAQEAVVEGIAADRADLGSGEVKVLRYSPNRVELRASASAPAFLVTSEAMFPGWQGAGERRGGAASHDQWRFSRAEPPSGRKRHRDGIPSPLLLAQRRSQPCGSGVRGCRGGWTVGATEARMKNLLRTRPTLCWILLLVPTTLVFYWKILLTGQFSLLTDIESVNQGYSWLQFWITSLRHGTLPFWDPYTMAGHSFSGEMQTGAFNPLRLLLVLAPFNRKECSLRPPTTSGTRHALHGGLLHVRAAAGIAS